MKEFIKFFINMCGIYAFIIGTLAHVFGSDIVSNWNEYIIIISFPLNALYMYLMYWRDEKVISSAKEDV
jgi:hypothetical protein